MTMPIRVVIGVKTHFKARVLEWLLTYWILGIGIRILLPDNVFDLPTLFVLNDWMDEDQWGLGCLLVGMARLTALIINGTLYNIQELRVNKAAWARALVWYSKYSPHVRALMSMLTCFFWVTIFLALLLAGAVGWGVVIYSGMILAEFWCGGQATIDADRVNRDYVPT